MTIQEVLDQLDEMKPNMMSRRLKVKYLTEIEQLIYDEIVQKHVQAEEPAGKPVYTEDSDPGTVLIIPDPYSSVYLYWLMTKVDIQNQEDARYNIDRQHFENAYDTMSDWYTREHMPKQMTREFRL
jgi:hypothetical protein